MSARVKPSPYCIILCTLCCLTACSLPQGAMQDLSKLHNGSNTVSYVDLPESDDRFGISLMQINGNPIGCGAISKRTTSPIILNILRDGGGGISLMASAYNLHLTEPVGELNISIGQKHEKRFYYLNDGVITFPLSKEDFAAMEPWKIRINGISVDRLRLKALHQIIKNCLAAHLQASQESQP